MFVACRVTLDLIRTLKECVVSLSFRYKRVTIGTMKSICSVWLFSVHGKFSKVLQVKSIQDRRALCLAIVSFHTVSPEPKRNLSSDNKGNPRQTH